MEQRRSEAVVLVTGGGSGIGRATAHAYADLGATVVVTGRGRDALAATSGGGRRVHPVPVDLTRADDVHRLHDLLSRRWGRLDVLVNNAAVVGDGPLHEHEPDAARAVVETNLLAPVRLTAALLPLLVTAGGVIVNVSASIGLRGWPGGAVYAATKAGLESLTRSWAVELAPRGVRVVGVAPGAIETRIGQRNGSTGEQVRRLRTWQVGHTPLGRLGRPEEIADAVVALSSPKARFVTGAILAVDGGAVVA